MPEHFFICGAQRSATTYLYRMLDQHPGIAMAKPMRPEPKYFIRPRANDDLAEYRATFFAGADAQWFGEKSTSYIEYPEAAERISRLLPDATLFFMLRDPVERAISNYRFSHGNGLEPLSIERALDAEAGRIAEGGSAATSVSPYAYVARGRYVDYLEPWFAHFPASRIHLLVAERLVGSRDGLRDVFARLGLGGDIPLEGVDEPFNQSSSPSGIPEGVRERLRAEFAGSNLELQRRYGVDVGAWG
ncbi:sulfotransferase [Pseudoluteimonas lycopersici]|uniref:Sulfotransferase n=1 Tax=Pseudoluteimonas lycopersici TaxID=1324796 RepID=A0A516V7D8_9GAMM|nr:sulfotransferase [Lysobacter lycopersici]QDQ74423.1 sulfotransferase [Lysobacter lycopersici]